MIVPAGLLAVVMAVQIPSPVAAANLSDGLRRQERLILDGEAERLKAIADRLARNGQAEAAAEVRRGLPAPPSPEGATRFRPLPEVVPRHQTGLANVGAGVDAGQNWRAERTAVRIASAGALFALAHRAATSQPAHFAIADACLRAVLDRQPDHPEARRLLGFVPHQGGWATPYAIRQLRNDKALHPTFGWVKASWLPHLERGELPAPLSAGQKTERWLAAEDADALRRDWQKGRWKIDTEHFRIETNVPLSEAIQFGRHLEAFHDLFFSVLADVFGERLPLAQRFKDKKAVGEKTLDPHKVDYFATREEFVGFIRPYQGADAERCLGVYIPPPPGKKRRAPAYFFRDPDGQLDVTATLYHEVSHQLLFETGTAGLRAYERNAGDFWVFEGMGTYFESLVTRPDGSIEIGGKVGRRMEAARESLVVKGRTIPLADFVDLDQNRFNDPVDVFLHYQQADALATFLMDGKGGAYREHFLDYFTDAYHGRLRANAGRRLDDRIGKPYADLTRDLLDYLSPAPAGR